MIIDVQGGANVGHKDQRNLQIDDQTWKYVSLMAAHTGMYKKDIVKEAIIFLYNHSFRKDDQK